MSAQTSPIGAGSFEPDHALVLAIQELLDGVEWTPDTLQEIAQLLERNGYRVADIREPVTDEERSNGPKRS